MENKHKQNKSETAKKSRDNAGNAGGQKQNKISATDTLYFEKWLSELGKRKGTDLHLSVGNVPMIRVDGKIRPLSDEDILTKERVNSIVENLLSKTELERLKKEKQIVLSRTLKKVMRFRIHIFYSRGFLGLSLRHLPSETIPISKLPHASVLSSITSLSQGLFIVAGPFDSGKTSTVKSMLSEINNTQEKYIVTLENPVEYIIPSNKSSVVQRETGSDVESFSEGISSMREEDVDVLYVSEVKNAQVLEEVLSMATSGRLCLASVPLKGAVAVLEELRDLADQADRLRILHLLADAILGVSTQLLLPKIGGGRTLIASSMIANHPIKSLIRDNKFSQIPNTMQTSGEDGMITLDKALAEAVRGGSIELRDAKENVLDPNQFNTLV